MSRILTFDDLKKTATERHISFMDWTLQHYRINATTPFSFVGHYYLKPLYEAFEKYRKVYIKKPAQKGISELFIAATFYSQLVMKHVVFYAFPTNKAMEKFVAGRVNKAKLQSEYIKKQYFLDKNSVNNTAMKVCNNTSVYFGGADSELNVKTVDADQVILDEVDEWKEEMIAKIQTRHEHSAYKGELGGSTPIYDNTGIDKIFKGGSQGYYHLKCPHCGKWQIPSLADNLYMGKYLKFVCSFCGGDMDRLAPGEYVHKYVDNPVKTFQVNPLVCIRTNIAQLYNEWLEFIGGDMMDEDARNFANQKLGQTFAPKGNKISLQALDGCTGDYFNRDIVKGGVLGIDVGKVLHCVLTLPDDTRPRKFYFAIREQRNSDRLTELCRIINRYDIQYVVIDAMPETGLARDLIAQFRGQVLMARYTSYKTPSPKTLAVNQKDAVVTIDRLKMMDKVRFNIDNRLVSIPKDFRNDPEIADHYIAPTRVMEKDNNGNVFATYVEGGLPDHYYHADVYSTAALILYEGAGITIHIDKTQKNNIPIFRKDILSLLERYKEIENKVASEEGWIDYDRIQELGKFTDAEMDEIEAVMLNPSFSVPGIGRTFKLLDE